MSFLFLSNSILLGAGLAMDAFSVSIVDALREPEMRRRRRCEIAGVFGLFQCLMPLIGWFCVREIASAFQRFVPLIPWIALVLLVFLGGRMLLEGVRGSSPREEKDPEKIGGWELLMQGVATSIDALSVGFAIAGHTPVMAVTAGVIIGLVTFGISAVGLFLGRRLGTKISSGATILGGCLLIGVGLEIFFLG